MEAGLRTYDKYSPFPEEMNRVLTSKIADLHFAPTKTNKNNLLKEGSRKVFMLLEILLLMHLNTQSFRNINLRATNLRILTSLKEKLFW